MKTLRTLLVLVIAVLSLTLGYAATGNAASPSDDDRVCPSPYTVLVGHYGLRYHGTGAPAPDYGYLAIYRNPEGTFACAYTRSGSQTAGYSKSMTVTIGIRARGSTDNPITWQHTQSGDYKYWAGPVYTNYLKSGQCVVGLGAIGKPFEPYSTLEKSTYCH